jgi:hypothetical protein
MSEADHPLPPDVICGSDRDSNSGQVGVDSTQWTCIGTIKEK